MKEDKVNKLIEESYYDLLDLKQGATDEEVEEAYEQIKKTCVGDSIATHSLFSHEEKKAIFEKATRAYEALKDPTLHSKYNQKNEVTKQETVRKDVKEPHNSKEPRLGNQWDYELHDTGLKMLEIKKPLVALDDANSLAAEQFRIICTKIEQTYTRRNHKVLAITSAIQGEGKTTTTMNLAYILAHEFKKKVLLIDGDLRRPSLPIFVELQNSNGLSDILTGRIDPSSALHSLCNGNLTCLPAASKALPNPIEILSSPNMQKLIGFFKRQFDYVLIDSPPVLPVADMNIISEIVDGLLFVVRADKTPKDIVLKALKSISKGNVVGIVLNGAAVSSRNYSKYYGY